MFQDISPHIYHNEFSKKSAEAGDHILIFSKQGLLCRLEDHAVVLPTLSDLGEAYAGSQHLFSIDDIAYYLHEGEAPETVEGWNYEDTRQLRECRPDEHLFASAAAESLWRWYSGNRFCGRCGGKMTHGTTERSQVCPDCGNTVYPKICPAVIVAVHDGDRLVLTKYAGRAFTRYALIAGFNEIGESIEDTVCREVLEEVGLHVKNLHFYKSQPWVFTDTLLMGFFAELDGDDKITIQEDELSLGVWLRRDEIPEDYSNISLTGEMIEYFRRNGAPR